MGVHYIAVDFCNCRHGIFHQRTQLLRARWFPATVNRPKTVFTFDCLDTYHELSLQGKTTAFDFYHAVLRRTDNVQLEKDIVSLGRALSHSPLADYFFVAVSVSRIPAHHENLAPLADVETSRAWSRPIWC